MRLTIHRGHFGVDSDGQWWQRVNDDWIAIDRPAWSKKKPGKKQKVVDMSEFRMKEPEGYARKTTKVGMVKVYRIIEKTVPDYEAEVLCRNGWGMSPNEWVPDGKDSFFRATVPYQPDEIIQPSKEAEQLTIDSA